MRTLRSPWIVSPRYDLAFFSTLWFVPAMFGAMQGLGRLGVSTPAVLLLFLAGLYLPHVASTVQVVSTLRQRSVHWSTLVAAPVVLGIVFSLPSFGSFLIPQRVGDTLLAVAMVWGIHHVGMQNSSLLRQYRKRAGLEEHPDTTQLEGRILWMLIIAGAEGVISPLIGAHDAVKAFVDVTQACFYFAVGFCLLSYVKRTIRPKRRQFTTWPALLFLLSAAAAMVPWPFYGRASSPVLQASLFFIVFNGHHSLAALGLRFMEREQPVTPRAIGRFVAPLVGVSMLALWVVTGAFTLRGLENLLTEATIARALTLLSGLFVVHYYFEELARWTAAAREPAVEKSPAVPSGLRVAG